MKQNLDGQDSLWLQLLAVLVVTAGLIYCSGGIGIGDGNHAGLLPVVRRILNPNYLPGDFNIELRFYHHRAFAFLVAGASWLLGEDRALILLRVLEMLGLSGALWALCRAVGLPLSGYLAVSGFVATEFLWTGRGLELNNFLGDPEAMPPLLAHTMVLLALVAIIKERYRWGVILVGLTVLLHLQIGITLAFTMLPFYLVKLRQFGVRETALLLGLFFLPALPAVWHTLHMLQRGLASTPLPPAEYIDFRHPHHFALLSGNAALAVGAHLLVMAAVYVWLRKQPRPERRAVGVLLAASGMILLLSLIHFADYYLIKHNKLAQIQFLRVTPVITVLGSICAVWALNEWQRQKTARRDLGWLVNAVLLCCALGWGVYAVRNLDANYYFGVRRYADEPTSWSDVCRWIKAHGPQATYLTPPGRRSGFTVLTDRSNVVEFKLNPDGALNQAEWFARLRDLSGGALPKERGFDNRKPLDRAYGKLSEEQLRALSVKYNADYAVLPQTSNTKFDVLYQNDDYRVVKLR